ncbi:hypothetical protein BH23GEM2_BH23GEM2_22810 [soil metagenome]
MLNSVSSVTPRRGFMKGVAAGAAALVAARWSSAHAAALPRPATDFTSSDDWVSRIKGKHRQVFDAAEINSGFAAVYALNFLESTKQAHNLPDSELTAVVSFRHFATPLLLKDEIWAKYRIGALPMINVTDPQTSAPALRNIFHDNIMLYPGLTYESVMATRPVIMPACSLALTVLSSMAAAGAGVSAEQAKAEWFAGLIPGAIVVPSGVYAVNRAQQAGCTFCTA